MKFIVSVLLVACGLALVNGGGYGGGGYGGGYGDGFDDGYDGIYGYGNGRGFISDFYRVHRVPYYAYRQRTPFGYRFFFKRSVPSTVSDIVTCNYSSSDSLLKCSRLDNVVECNAVEVLDKSKIHKFNSYGISATPIKSSDKVEYSLYPERLDKSGFKHSKIRDSLTKRVYQYSLYTGPENVDNGFRVTDATCFQKINDLFSQVKQPEKIVLGMKPGKVDEVSIAGKVFKL